MVHPANTQLDIFKKTTCPQLAVSPGLNVLSEGFFTPAMKCFPDKHFDLGRQCTIGALWRACQVLSRQGQAWEAGWADGCVQFEAKRVRAERLRRGYTCSGASQGNMERVVRILGVRIMVSMVFFLTQEQFNILGDTLIFVLRTRAPCVQGKTPNHKCVNHNKMQKL